MSRVSGASLVCRTVCRALPPWIMRPASGTKQSQKRCGQLGPGDVGKGRALPTATSLPWRMLPSGDTIPKRLSNRNVHQECPFGTVHQIEKNYSVECLILFLIDS